MATRATDFGQVAPLRASSGIVAYDAANWRGWVPQARRILTDAEGLSTLNQVVPPQVVGTAEAVVLPQPCDILLLWRNGAPGLQAWMDQTPTRMTPRAGQGVLLPAGLPTRWLSTAANSHDILHLHFAPGFLAGVAAEAGMEFDALPVVARLADPLTAQLGFWLSDSLVDAARPTRLFWDSGAVLLARRLLEVTGNLAPHRSFAKGGLAAWQLRRATEALAAHADAELRLADLATLVGLSAFHFARAFKQSTGLPPHRYQVRLRLERAKAMLTETRLSVSDIAAAVGYDSPQTLARLFRRELGLSPSTWRREQHVV